MLHSGTSGHAMTNPQSVRLDVIKGVRNALSQGLGTCLCFERRFRRRGIRNAQEQLPPQRNVGHQGGAKRDGPAFLR